MQNRIVDRETWLQARAELLQKEKEHTHARAALAKLRQELPWVKLEKNYELKGPEGDVAFADLFSGQSQLAVYHLMFGTGWDKPCPGCTQWANALNDTTSAFTRADARLIAISRAPCDEIAAQRERLGWSFDWYSSAESDFNVDFFASSDDTSPESTRQVGEETVSFDRGENHGVSVFYRNDSGEIFHTYSAYNRGIEDLNGAFGYFDLLPKGRAW